MPKEINILIVHYNTPFLTKCLVKSINKFTPGANIYIFDNSNVAPFDSSFLDNVTILDNTRGQYIDFDRCIYFVTRKYVLSLALSSFSFFHLCLYFIFFKILFI